jgi:predicted nucleic acid-binding protein
MIYIIDTNILIFQIRDEKFNSSFIREYLVKGNILAMSEVTLGEIKAFAMQHEWGIAKQQKMNEIINYYNIIDLSTEIIEMYAIIDTYSQGKLAKRPLRQ